MYPYSFEDFYPPPRRRGGFLQPPPGGRPATPHAFRHLGLRPPENAPQLFG